MSPHHLGDLVVGGTIRDSVAHNEFTVQPDATYFISFYMQHYSLKQPSDVSTVL